jgi:tetratricopeptide (TPR) repeat protein
MSNNKKNQLFLWLFPIFLLMVGISMTYNSIIPMIKGNDSSRFFYMFFIVPGGMLIFGVLRYYSMLSKGKTQIRRDLKHHSPDQLIKTFNKNALAIKKTNNKRINLEDIEISTIYNVALSYCYYGDFKNSMETLEQIDWNNQKPDSQCLELLLLALICYLKDQNYEKGLTLSKNAYNLTSFSKSISSNPQQLELYDIYIVLGEALLNPSNFKFIDFLESKFEKINAIFLKLLVAWGLANIYQKNNLPEKAKEKLDFCKTSAPYCTPLHTLYP